jgi:glutamate synthase (NADPH/NADH)
MDEGKEPLGSMGNDTTLACLSMRPRMSYDYFKQLFAQVTNPPIDPIREEVVMSLACYTGPMGNILELHPSQCRRLRLHSPILSVDDLQCLRNIDSYDSDWRVAEIDITFPKIQGVNGYISALDTICLNVEDAIKSGFKIAILSDYDISPQKVAISGLLALGAVHHHLVKLKLRSRIALVVETGEAREVHQFCVLLGYGADASKFFLLPTCSLSIFGL